MEKHITILHFMSFIKTLNFVSANPTIKRGLKIYGQGINGGDGGEGGDGGNGASGAKGKTGRTDYLGPFPICGLMGGRGGDGGNASSGGKGGTAGKGGDGVSMFLVGPVENNGIFDVYQEKGIAGTPGNPGLDGTPGGVGGGGDNPSVCPTPSYSANHPGYLIPNPFKSIGDSNTDGDAGTTFYIPRNNTDI